MEREGTAVTCDGRLFHRQAAATGNALSSSTSNVLIVVVYDVIVCIVEFIARICAQKSFSWRAVQFNNIATGGLVV